MVHMFNANVSSDSRHQNMWQSRTTNWKFLKSDSMGDFSLESSHNESSMGTRFGSPPLGPLVPETHMQVYTCFLEVLRSTPLLIYGSAQKTTTISHNTTQLNVRPAKVVDLQISWVLKANSTRG